MSNLLDAAKWRYATKKFDSAKKVSDADFQELLDVTRFAPSSFGLQPWKFVVVEDPAVRAQLRGAAWDQAQVTDASHLVVLCAKLNLTEQDVDTYVADVSKTRGTPMEALAGYKDMMMGSVKRQTPEGMKIWNQKQVYIALGFLLAAAAEKQIDTCPMEGFDPAKFDEILGLTAQGLTATVVCPVGYRSAEDASGKYAKVRFGSEDVVIRV